MGPERLDDVARSHERDRSRAEPIGESGEPVLLAPMNMDDIRPLEPSAETSDIARIPPRPKTRAQREGVYPLHPLPSGPRDHALFAAAATDEGSLMAGSVKRVAHAGRPIRIGRPPPAGHDL